MSETPDNPQDFNPLSVSDLGMARVTEDLIDALIERGILPFTDLPPQAQAKLMERALARSDWAGKLKLLDDESENDGKRGLI